MPCGHLPSVKVSCFDIAPMLPPGGFWRGRVPCMILRRLESDSTDCAEPRPRPSNLARPQSLRLRSRRAMWCPLLCLPVCFTNYRFNRRQCVSGILQLLFPNCLVNTVLKPAITSDCLWTNGCEDLQPFQSALRPVVNKCLLKSAFHSRELYLIFIAFYRRASRAMYIWYGINKIVSN